MVVIGVCDGEQTVRSLLASFVERYKCETNAEIQLLSYDTGEKLLKNYMLDLDLVFLEIPLRQVNGLVIAEHLRRFDSRIRIVFLTSVLTHVLEAYDIGASNYLLKPLSYAKFCKEMSRIHNKGKEHEVQSFLEQRKSVVHKIYFYDVRYIETSGKSTLIHTVHGPIPGSKQMKQYEALFHDSALIRCHAGYIVNLRFFQTLEETTIVLTDGTKIPVSRSRRKQVLSRICQIYGDEI